MSEVVFVLGVLGPFAVCSCGAAASDFGVKISWAPVPATIAEAIAAGGAHRRDRKVPADGPATKLWNWLTETQVWTSVFRHERPNTDRNRVLVMLSNVFLHLHPVRIRKSGVKLRYTWCMGGLSFFLFLVADASPACC